MNKSVIKRSLLIYGLILRLYPAKYRQEFGEEMKFVFSEYLKDAYLEKGEQGIFTFWVKTIYDAVKSIYIQHILNKRGGVSMKCKRNDLVMQNKIFIWIAVATGLILSVPLIAMQFTNEVDWKLGDFIFMGTLIFGMGALFVYFARVFPRKYRLVLGLGVLVALLLIWVHLAVGIVDTWPLAGS